MNVNSTSSYVNSASSNKGFSGIASGLDTESMVESMLASTQAKIDKQTGLKQQIEWKQEIYREIITQLNTFQNQFFNTNSSTNLLSDAFFNAMNAITASNAFKVTATSSAAVGNTSLEVRQLATSTTITSGAGVSGKLAGTLDEDAVNELIQQQLGDDSAYTVKFQVGDKTVEANLRDVFVDGDSFRQYDSTAQRDAAIQAKLEEAFSGTGVTASVKDGTVSLSHTDSTITVSSDSGSIGLERLGLTAGDRSVADSTGEPSTLTGEVNEAPTMSFTVTLDDLQKEIKIDLRKVMDSGGALDQDSFFSELQAQLDAAHGIGQIQVVRENGQFELKVSAGRKVVIGGTQTVLDALGVKNGQSNRIGMNGALKDLYFANGLQGSNFKFTINGESFSFTADSTMSDVMNAINRSDAGVRLVYRAQSDTFTLEMTETGAGRVITMSQEEGNLLNALFGSGADGSEIVSGGRLTSGELWSGSIAGTPVLTDGEFQMAEGKLILNVNGTDYTFSLAKRSAEDGGDYTKDEIISELNKQLDSKFGAGAINFADDGTLKITNGASVTVKVGSVSDPSDPDIVKEAAKAGDLGLAFFGTSGGSNAVSGDTTLGELGITGLYGKDGQPLSADTKLSELADKTDYLSYEDGRIIASGTGTDLGSKIGDSGTLVQLFGTDSINLGVASGTQAVLTEGQNAVVEIDGVLTERSSNNFSVNGLNITLTGTTGSYVKGQRVGIGQDGSVIFPPEGSYIDENGDVIDSVTGKPVLDSAGNPLHYPSWEYRNENGERVDGAAGLDSEGYLIDAQGNRIFNGSSDTIEVSRNTDQIVDGIKQFIDAYNNIVKTLNDYLDEDTTYREYAPLTDAQKKEMSEKEIELWEEKAKQGLLHRDSTIDTFLQSMRTAMYEKPAGSAYAIYDLGIETGDWESKGQLVLSADGEARLRQMIESDPSGVMQLFTDAEEGLAVKLNNILDQTAKTSSGSPGTLVQLAGVEGKASETNNTLYTRMQEIDEKIAALKRTYEKEKERYWDQFNAMEQMIATMTSQSSWLTQQLGM